MINKAYTTKDLRPGPTISMKVESLSPARLRALHRDLSTLATTHLAEKHVFGSNLRLTFPQRYTATEALDVVEKVVGRWAGGSGSSGRGRSVRVMVV